MAQTKITVDGITGLTSSATELNYVDITTLGTAQASKVLTADANIDVGLGLRNLTGTGFLQGSTILVKGTTNSITIDADNPSAYTVVLPNAAPAAGKVLKTTSSSTTQLEWGDAGGGDFTDGGDSVSATMDLGTNSNNDLAFRTNNTTRIVVAAGGITTFTSGGNEIIHLENTSGIKWALQSTSTSEFRISDVANSTTRLKMGAGTSGEMYLKENSSYINVNKVLAKAWLNFYHAVTIQENYNCAVVHHDTGKYRIDIGTDMETADYAVVHGSSYDRLVTQDNGNHNTVASAYLYTAQFNGTLINVPNDQTQTCGAAIFGTAT